MRSLRLPLRLFLDFGAAILLIAGLAYYWLDNLAHELIGSAFFALIAAHAIFNRRWYGALLKGRYDAKRSIAVAVNLTFLGVILILLVSSVGLSRSLLGFAGFDPGYAVRQIHMLAAYWAIACLGVHLGLQWPTVMKIARSALRIRVSNPWRTAFLRMTALTIALYGIRSSFDMTFGSKLVLSYTLDMWDFHTQTLRFFVNFGAIIGLYAALTHYGLTGLQRRKASAVAGAADAHLSR
ncbi:DUF4405 domain-containing protein [Ancylobacter sp. WKF20]|uniref:DUF4405 domain-containing protein n=1 Tax=Ancylobacter sp. WKF20 TaxID=3039801 RepID=UPI00243427E0|nr:DUF4405 domain-containing protein [Ancylobacter sp. WKF20]WGD32239.1 DUF4405 domain-containing protein [Ancylobacter sp. WKF20]